jgi:hypothetical protein
MKKLLFVLTIAGLMTACKSKKADEKKPDETTTTPTAPTTTAATESTTTTAAAGVPSFSDPEVQKFANDYGAFMAEYKAGMKDPAKLATLAKTLQDWTSRSKDIGMKLATKPDEARAWAEWVLAFTKDMMPSMK